MANYELSTISRENVDPSSRDTEDDVEREPEVRIITNIRTDSNPMASFAQVPQDKYSLIFMIFLLHGIGTLMPWNMFINANDYFVIYKLGKNEDPLIEEQLVDIRKNFLSTLGLASQLPNVLFNGLNILIDFGSGNIRARVNASLAIEAILFVITIILASVDSSNWQMIFFYITMATCTLLNMANGVYQNCVYGMAAKFPGSYTNAVLIGTNLSGTFTSIVQILTMWLAADPRISAIYYFVTALVVIVVCLVTFVLLHLSSFFQFYNRETNQTVEVEKLPLDEKGASTDVPESLQETIDAMVPKRGGYPDDNTFKGLLMKKYEVLELCWPQLLNVYLTFLLTLSLFPSVLANITRPTSNLDISDRYFKAIFCFLMFNASAMFGNLFSSCCTWPGKKHVWILVLARFLLVPYFLFSNFNTNSRNWTVLISNDFAYIIGNFILAFSSGYLSSLCMMFTSSDLSSGDAAIAGMLGGFFLIFGILSGVGVSFIFTKLVEL